jgi:hypothetical protein
MHGKLLSEKKNEVTLQAHSMQLLEKVTLPANTDEVFFLKLMLSDQDNTVDENLYWLSNKRHSYEKLNELQKISVKTEINKGNEGQSAITLSNAGNETAFFIRLKVINSNNELILPAYFTENFMTLLPGESREIMLDLSTGKAPTGLNGLKLVIEGWNVPAQEIEF